MDPLDDLDSLLDMEEELLADHGPEEGDGGHKRSHADLLSRQEAAASLGGGGAAGPPSGPKRPRVGVSGGSASLHTFLGPGATEERRLLGLAMDSQQAGSQSVAAAATTTAGAGRSLLAESEEQRLLALARGSQVTQSELAAPGGAARSSRAADGAAAPGRPGFAMGSAEEDDAYIDAALDDLLNEQEAEAAELAAPAAQQQPAAGQQQTGEAGASGAAPAAASQQEAAPVEAATEFLPRRQYVPPAREVYRIQGASLTVTGEGGDRVYCQLEAAQQGGTGRRLDMAGALRRARGGLLQESISSLLQAVEKDQYDRAVAETTAAAQQGGASGERRSSGAAAGAAGVRRGTSSLWVQKYSPKGYIDLLSDEQINREVVHWLKGWDPCVFGTTAPDQLAHSGRGMGSRSHPNQHGRPGGRFGGGGGVGGGQQDPLGRPEHKVILIAGPPGLGKTTLAHVCAAHCGYRPVEVNASDDRSAGALQARILDAVEMQSVMGQRRPNCVIIDEIDGAAGGAEGRSGIAALLKIISAAPGKGAGKQGADKEAQPPAGADSDSDDDEGGDEEAPTGRGAGRRAAATAAALGKQGGRRQQQLRPLMRPIICICNDLYAPALRPLRDVARVFHFKKPQAERLAQRLHSICAAEGLQCEKSTLRLLVERTDCDIRSCLNTLQFLAKKQSAVRLADLAGLRVGQKDMTKGAFSVWTDLLQKRKAPGIVGKAAESEAQRSQRLFGMLMDFGESDLVLGGVHENVLGLKYFDMALQRTCAVVNCLGDADRLLRACHRVGDFGILKYVPATMVQLSNHVAGPDRLQLQWPRAAMDCHRRGIANLAMLRGWMLGMAPATYAASSARSMVLEVLPQLMHIAAPALRPVSQHLYSPQELAVVRQLVDTLLCYNLRYCLDTAAEEQEAEEQRQQQQQEEQGAEAGQAQAVRGAHAEPPLRFRPAVHRACTFPGMPPKGKHLPAAVRQTVSHEADMEAIRRAEGARRGSAANATGLTPGAASGAAGAALGQTNQQRLSVTSGPVPVTLAERMKAAGTAAAAARKAAVQRKTTWLDKLKDQRQAREAAGGSGAAGDVGGRPKFPVLYKFHEGYTNAVKRPVLMQELFASPR